MKKFMDEFKQFIARGNDIFYLEYGTGGFLYSTAEMDGDKLSVIAVELDFSAKGENPHGGRNSPNSDQTGRICPPGLLGTNYPVQF